MKRDFIIAMLISLLVIPGELALSFISSSMPPTVTSLTGDLDSVTTNGATTANGIQVGTITTTGIFSLGQLQTYGLGNTGVFSTGPLYVDKNSFLRGKISNDKGNLLLNDSVSMSGNLTAATGTFSMQHIYATDSHIGTMYTNYLASTAGADLWLYSVNTTNDYIKIGYNTPEIKTFTTGDTKVYSGVSPGVKITTANTSGLTVNYGLLSAYNETLTGGMSAATGTFTTYASSTAFYSGGHAGLSCSKVITTATATAVFRIDKGLITGCVGSGCTCP